jgi:hypothetical protein
VIHRLEFTADAIQGVVVLEVPVAGLVRFDARFQGSAVGPGLVMVRDTEVPRARGTALEFRADGLWVDFVCETPDEHWSFGLEAFGLRVDDPAEEIGERIPVGFDLEGETPDSVHGEVLVGRTAIAVHATGSFTLRQ